MSTFLIVAFLLTGVFSGTVAGLLGVGGGMIIVPMVVWILSSQGLGDDNAIKIAVATSLAIIIPTSISSTLAHHRSGALQWDIVKRMLPGILIGTALGGLLVDSLPDMALRIIFAVGCWAIAAKMLFGGNPSPSRTLPQWPGLNTAGAIIGGVSALLGIGGGSLTVPFLHWCNVNMREAVATSAACGLPIAVSGALTLVIAGQDVSSLPDNSIGYLYLPALICISISAVVFAPVGAKLAHTLPLPLLKKCVAVFILAAGINMTLKVLGV
jgi:hypothetical protein